MGRRAQPQRLEGKSDREFHNKMRTYKVVVINLSLKGIFLLNIRITEWYLFYYLHLIYWHFIEILWLFIFIILYENNKKNMNRKEYRIRG